MKKQTAKQVDYLNAFSTQIRQILKDNKLTQKQLAKAIGVTPNAVNEWINEKSQPKWLLQMFGTIKFFYENVEGFNPMQLFIIEDFDLSKNGYDPLRIPVENKIKEIEQNCNKEIERIKRQAQYEIQQVKDKYNGNKIDELTKQVKELQQQVNSLLNRPNRGRQDYQQFKDKLNEKYEKLQNEYKDYKEAYNGLLYLDLTEQEFEDLSKSLTVKSSFGDGKRRMKKLLNNPDFHKLLRKAFYKCLPEMASKTEQLTQQDYEDLGRKLVELILPLTPYQPTFRNDQ